MSPAVFRSRGNSCHFERCRWPSLAPPSTRLTQGEGGRCSGWQILAREGDRSRGPAQQKTLRTDQEGTWPVRETVLRECVKRGIACCSPNQGRACMTDGEKKRNPHRCWRWGQALHAAHQPASLTPLPAHTCGDARAGCVAQLAGSNAPVPIFLSQSLCL